MKTETTVALEDTRKERPVEWSWRWRTAVDLLQATWTKPLRCAMFKEQKLIPLPFRHLCFVSRPTAMIYLVASVLAIAVTGCGDTEYGGAAKNAPSSGYAAMFGNFAERGADWNPRTPAEIVSVSFSLPVDAYVSITSSGEVTFVRDMQNSPGMAQFWIAMDDKGRRGDWDTYRFHEGAFSLSCMYKLKKGRHTASLMGSPQAGNYNFGYMSAHITAIATQEGDLKSNTWFTPE